MPKQRSPNRYKAFLIYKDYNGNIDLVKIAETLDLSPGTIRGWKNKDQWDNKLNGTFQKKCNKNTERSKHKKVNKESKKEPIADEVKEVLENEELTDKQRLFCVIYSKRQNATKAYQKAYKCTYETAMVEGCKALRNPKIKKQINRLLEAELNKEFLKRGLIQKYKDIAFSDIGDYLEFGKKLVPQWTKNDKGENIPVIDPNTEEQKIKEYSYIDLKDSISVDTSLIAEVSEGKDGIKIKLPDKLKAMDMLVKISNLLSNEEKIKLELEYKKLTNEKIKAEINSMKGNGGDSNNKGIKDFIEATRPSKDEIKELFEGDENEKEKEN
ncbi:phage portal protein [Clostridium acetobutylicum]|nr:phage portal protein [Clostridium acetobutylicum]